MPWLSHKEPPSGQMPRDRQRSSRSRSRSPRRYKDTDTDVHRLDSRKYDDARPSRSARSRSRSRSREKRSRSPTRKKERRHHSRSSSSSRSRSRSRERRHKRRSRSRSRSKERKKKRRRSRSPSSSSESETERSRRKKGKHREKDEKRARSKERRKEKKREKKERREKKKDKGTVPQWGKYGIISDIDIFTKGTEFHTWLVEERKINPETISKDQEKKEFSRFVEDYNTATLPHEKYYNMEFYERRMAALRSGEYLPPADDSYDFNADMTALRGAHKKKSADPETYLSREQLMELRKVQQERIEVGRMKLLGMDVKQNFGVRMDGTNFDD